MPRSSKPVVLAVDDSENVLDTYELWLEGEFRVRTTSSGRAALEQLDADVDVVLLDRMMPGLTGGEVLERIRQRDPDPQVVMLTALDPGFDVVDMAFDAYVTKPVSRADLRSSIRTVLERERYARQVRTYYSLVERRTALFESKSGSALSDDDRYQELVDRIERVEDDLGELVADIDHDEFVALTAKLSESRQ
jgi:DNA-binding response OmpR family regulator